MSYIINTFLKEKAKDFFENNWLNQPFYLSNNTEEENQYVSVEEIDEYLNHGHLCHPLVSIIGHHGRTIGQEQLNYGSKGYPSFLINRKKLFKYFMEGNSIIINYSHLHFPRLKHLTLELEREFNSSVHGNIYITPPKSNGFLPHIDRHEVFVYQIHGTKTWYIYDKPYENPGINQQLTPDEINVYNNAAPQHKLVMYPGDILYIPKGVVHKAFTVENDSIHVTIGINHRREEDLVSSLTKENVFKNDIIFRETNKDALAKAFKEKVNEVIDSRITHFFEMNQDEYFETKFLFKNLMMLNLIDQIEDLDYFKIEKKDNPHYLVQIKKGNDLDQVKNAIKSDLMSGSVNVETPS